MIRFTDVCKRFRQTQVLDHLNLHIPRDSITFIIGKSGEGKSVTIKHIIGLLQPDTGKIFVDDEEITSKNDLQLRTYRKKIGMLFQHSALFDSMNVLDNVTFPLKEHTDFSITEMQDRAEECLAQVDLSGVLTRYPSELSTGQQKRVGLARALVNNPKILLYDEPTTGMDAEICAMIDELIVKISTELREVTSVVISHDIKAALAVAENIIMIHKGRVHLEGSPHVFKSSSDPFVQQFLTGRVI